jgi:hypothetical protein
VIDFGLSDFMEKIEQAAKTVKVSHFRSKEAQEAAKAAQANGGLNADGTPMNQEAINRLFCPSQEKFHTFVLRGLRNISEAP